VVDLDILLTMLFIEFRDKKGELVSAANQLKLTAVTGRNIEPIHLVMTVSSNLRKISQNQID